MIKLDPLQKKVLEFDINVEGIDPKELNYSLRLYSENFHIGFSGELKEDKVIFEIPELNALIKDISETMLLKFEVNDNSNKFYLNPFNESVQIEKIISVESKLQEKEEPEIKVTLKEKPKLNIFE